MNLSPQKTLIDAVADNNILFLSAINYLGIKSGIVVVFVKREIIDDKSAKGKMKMKLKEKVALITGEN